VTPLRGSGEFCGLILGLTPSARVVALLTRLGRVGVEWGEFGEVGQSHDDVAAEPGDNARREKFDGCAVVATP